MRRASRLGILPGEKVSVPELGAAFGACLQSRHGTSDPVQRPETRAPPVHLLKGKPRLSVSRFALFGPHHHHELRELKPRARHPQRQLTPPITVRRPKGNVLAVVGSESLAPENLDHVRPEVEQKLGVDPVDNDATHVLVQSESASQSHTDSQQFSEDQGVQGVSASTVPVRGPANVSPTGRLQVSLDDARKLPSSQSVAEFADLTSSTAHAHPGSAVVADAAGSTHQHLAAAVWPHVSSVVQQTLDAVYAVREQGAAEMVVRTEPPADVCTSEAILDTASAPKEAEARGGILQQNMLQTSAAKVRHVEQSLLLRVLGHPTDDVASEAPQAERCEPSSETIVHDMVHETHVEQHTTTLTESAWQGTPVTTAAAAPAARPITAESASVDDVASRGRLQTLQSLGEHPLLRAPALLDTKTSVLERAGMSLFDTPGVPAAGTTVQPQPTDMQNAPAALVGDVPGPVLADSPLPSDQPANPSHERRAEVRVQNAEAALPSLNAVLHLPTTSALPSSREAQLESPPDASGRDLRSAGMADTPGPRLSAVTPSPGKSLKLLQLPPSQEALAVSAGAPGPLLAAVTAPNEPTLTLASSTQTSRSKASSIASFGHVSNPAAAAKVPDFGDVLTSPRRTAPVAPKVRSSLLQAARNSLSSQHTSILFGQVTAPQAISAAPEGNAAAAADATPGILPDSQPGMPDLPLETRVSGNEQDHGAEQRKLDLSQLGKARSALLQPREVPAFLQDAAPRPQPAREPPAVSRHRHDAFAEPRSRFEQRHHQPYHQPRQSEEEVQSESTGEVSPAASQLSAMDMFKKMVDASAKGSAQVIKKPRYGHTPRPHQYQGQRQHPAVVQSVTISDNMTVRDLAHALHITPAVLDGKLVELGEVVESEEDLVSTDAAELVALDMGFECSVQTSQSGTDVRPRPPVVTIVGHVDHGKTTLLDCLRNSHVAEGEAGGITQHVGAFSVTMPDSSSKITFLDTPGHAAFSAMRARGTKVTDIAVLVVAADDGVMQTTREAIQHVNDANCSLIVALTKCDRPGARPAEVEAELMAEGLELESAGGTVQVVQVAGPKGIGLRELEESILLQSEILGVSAPVDTLPEASVVESHVDRGQGPIATVVVKQGVLRVGQPVVVGKEHGRVRSLRDPEGASVLEARPGMPVIVAGLKGVPHAGDALRATSSESRARDIADARAARAQSRHHAALEKLSMDHYATVVDESAGTTKQVVKPSVPLVLHADVDGSLEALTSSLLVVNTGRIVYKVVSAGVGPPSSRDVQMAMDTGACIVCFGVKLPAAVQREADSRGVSTVQSNVIYKLLDSLSVKLVESAPRVEERVTTGEVEVAATFHASVKKSVSATGKVKIAGCKVVVGRVRRDAVLVRVTRNGVVQWEGRIRELKQAKNNVDQVGKGSECGIMLSGWEDFQVGDKLEILEMQASQPKLASTASGAVRIEG